MPCDYRKYPTNWKSEIRPDILKRAEDRCEQCKVKNGIWVCRGKWGEVDVYQDDDGAMFSADNGEPMGSTYVGEVWDKRQILTKIVLTIAHIDHDIENNEYNNLKALCQRCHLHLDKDQHRASRRKTKLKKQPELF